MSHKQTNRQTTIPHRGGGPQGTEAEWCGLQGERIQVLLSCSGMAWRCRQKPDTLQTLPAGVATGSDIHHSLTIVAPKSCNTATRLNGESTKQSSRVQ